MSNPVSLVSLLAEYETLGNRLDTIEDPNEILTYMIDRDILQELFADDIGIPYEPYTTPWGRE
jgi:hypothetical protein